MNAMYVVGSASQAMHGQRILQRRGVQASVRRVTDEGQNGCGYALTAPENKPIAQWLQEGGVTVLTVKKEERS